MQRLSPKEKSTLMDALTAKQRDIKWKAKCTKTGKLTPGQKDRIDHIEQLKELARDDRMLIID